MSRFPTLVPELTVRDLTQSVPFYTELLGFLKQFERPEDGFIYLALGNAHLMLEQITAECWITAELEVPLGRGINLEISTEIAPILQRLQAAHYPLWRETRESWYRAGDLEIGVKEFLVQDPDGYLLRFSEEIGEYSVERNKR